LTIFLNRWKALSEEQKEPYKKKYASWKGESRNDYSETLSMISDSSLYSNIFDPKKQQYDFNEIFETLKMEVEKTNKIKDYIQQGDYVCRNHKWFVIKFQSFCKCDSFTYENQEYNPYYVLAEVSVVEFCLKNGVLREYHSFIRPNRIPMGYRSKCMDASRDLHEIPLENFEPAHHKEYHEIYRDIFDFIRVNVDEDEYNEQQQSALTVFSLQEDLEETKFGIDFLRDCYHYRYSKQQPREISIFRLELLITLFASQINQKVSCQAAHDLLMQYTYDYTPEIRCYFHENEKNNVNCSLGIVKKYCYLISDAICPLYDIDLTERHVPKLKSAGFLVRNEIINPRSCFKPDSDRNNRRNQYSETGLSTENSSNNSETGLDEDPEEFPDSSDTRSNISESSSTTSYPGNSTLTTVTSSYKTNTLSGRTAASSTRVLVSQKFESSLSGSAATFSNRAQKSIFSDDSSTFRTATTMTKTTTNTYCSDRNNADMDERSTTFSYASNKNNQTMSKDDERENDYDDEDEFEDNDWSDNYSQATSNMKNLKLDLNNNENDDTFSENSDQSNEDRLPRGTNASKRLFLGRGKFFTGKKYTD
jgi:hypothetical protein